VVNYRIDLLICRFCDLTRTRRLVYLKEHENPFLVSPGRQSSVPKAKRVSFEGDGLTLKLPVRKLQSRRFHSVQ
jgi:hypothetical protein